MSIKTTGKGIVRLIALCGVAAAALLLFPSAEAGVTPAVTSAPITVATVLPAAHHFGGHGNWGHRSFSAFGGWGHRSFSAFGGWGHRSFWGFGGWGRGSFWGFGGWYGWPYYYGPYSWGYPWYWGGAYVYVPHDRPSGPYSLIETDVKPLKSTVYLDGEAVGKADDYNGYPGKLAVKEGHHVLTFVRPGYENYTVEIDCIPYQSYKLKYKMKKLSVAGLEKYKVIPPTPPPPRQPAPKVEGNVNPPSGPQDFGCGDLVLRVYPYEASIYVDGQFKQAAEFDREVKITGLSCGRHRLEVLKPGFRTAVQEFTLEGGHDLFLKVTLEKGRML
jgi:hypothetical protein